MEPIFLHLKLLIHFSTRQRLFTVFLQFVQFVASEDMWSLCGQFWISAATLSRYLYNLIPLLLLST